MSGAPRLAIAIASDGLAALVTVQRGEALKPQALSEALAQAGVTFGLDDAAVARIAARLDKPKFEIRATQVAKGKPMVSGADGVFVPSLEMGIQPGRLRPDGSIDFHDRDLLKHVVAGDVLGTLCPPTMGLPGRRVDGREIPAVAGRPLRMTFGRGVAVSPEGQVRAVRAGVVALTPTGNLDVEDHHVHPADVDLHSGDVRMEGSLVVQGSVEAGLEARATGDLEILGQVDGGRAEAGGSLRVKGGVHGAADSLVCAKVDLIAHHAGAATIRCGGTLRLSEAVNSHLSGVRIEIARCVRGGSATAEESIVVGEAGSPQGISTLLVAGEPLDRALLEVRSALAAIKKVRLSDRRGTGRTEEAIVQERIAQRIELLRRRELLVGVARVDVVGVVYPGVVVQIHEQRMVVDEPQRHVRFSLDPETRHIRFERMPR